MNNFNDEFGDLSEYKMLSFEEISQGFSGNKNPLSGIGQQLENEPEYKDDKYINLNNLLDRIKNAYNEGKGSEMQYTYVEYFNDIQQTYIMDGNNHIDISAKIALKNGSIKVSRNLGNDKPFMEVYFDSKKRLTYSVSFCYSGSRQVAIVLKTHSFKEYRNLLLYLGYGDVESDYDASKFFIKEFTDFLKDTKNTADDLYKVYVDLPRSFIVHIHLTTEKVVEHLKILTEVDDTGWLSWTRDTSSLLITVLAMFRDYDKVVDYLNENPKFVNEIYGNLDGHSEVFGQPISNRILFTSTLNAFTQQDKDAKTKVTNVLTSYGNYNIESNILELNDTLNNIKSIVSFDWDFDYKDAIFLQQKRTITKVIEQQETDEFGKGGTTREETRTVNEDVDPGYFYNPMSPVIYFDKEGNSTLVTALFIKAIADEKEWAEVMHYIRIGGDILAIIAGVMTMGLAGEVSALAIADFTLAGIDLGLMNEDIQKWLSQYPEGKWFVKNWDLIYALVGTGILSVALIDGILTHGPDLLKRLKNIKNVKENYLIFTQQLEKLITELDAYKARTATNVIEEVVITAKKNALLEKLLKPFLSSDANLEYIIEQLAKRKISVKKAGDNLYEIYYNSKLVTATDANEVGAFLKDNFWKTEKQLQEVAKMAKPHDIDKYLGGKILKESQIRKFRGDLKKRGTALILEEDILLNNSGQITNKAVVKNFKPVILDRFKFDNIYDLYNYLRRKGYAGFFDHQNKQIILTKNPTEYLIFHEMAHLKHYEEIGDAYLLLQPWQRETYVFEEIWKQRHLWTKKELQHALDYVNLERKNAGQSLTIKKL